MPQRFKLGFDRRDETIGDRLGGFGRKRGPDRSEISLGGIGQAKV
jgi:hypothetical protein